MMVIAVVMIGVDGDFGEGGSNHWCGIVLDGGGGAGGGAGGGGDGGGGSGGVDRAILSGLTHVVLRCPDTAPSLPDGPPEHPLPQHTPLLITPPHTRTSQEHNTSPSPHLQQNTPHLPP